MSSTRREKGDRFRLKPAQLRWRCDPARFKFENTSELKGIPIRIIGQPRAQAALELGLSVRAKGFNVFVSGEVGSGRSAVVTEMFQSTDLGQESPCDLTYVHDYQNPDRPILLCFPAGEGKRFRSAMDDLIETLRKDLPKLFDSDLYRTKRAGLVEQASMEQKARLKEFERTVQEQGFTLAQVQLGPIVRSQLVPVVAGNPVEMDQLESLVEQGQFKSEDLEELRKRQTALQAGMEGLSKRLRSVDHRLRKELRELDRTLARPLVEEATTELSEAFPKQPIDEYLEQTTEDILEHLYDFVESDEASEAETARKSAAQGDLARYRINVIVDNEKTKGRPVIWETTPSYRNLFGAIEKTRADNGEWETDHTRIRAGSLLQANGGFLVLDALDVLVEPGVWAALKRTLRHRKVEIQSFDLAFLSFGVSMKPESVPIDVKVVMIGTRQIYRLLYGHDEDFKKIFKIKAEFAMETPLSDEELMNYACLVHKRCERDRLPPFQKQAVAAIAEEGAKLAERQDKLTTRFSEIADLVRESGYWAKKKKAKQVRAAHVDHAVSQRIYRVDLVEEMLRERMAEGQVLLDLSGEEVGQANGLAVLNLGDHVFAQPSRITANTAMGRLGIIDIDRESDMSGAIHTKGVLILTGFLRWKFAQNKPLALTASIAFEQTYGGVDGDSASSTELYALISSLSEVPIRQGIAITGSVNQRGEVQPIGGVNQKIEGYFDLCNLLGLNGEQGVMIPTQNVNQLMLRKDVVAAVRKGKFGVWAVSSIDEGLEVLCGARPGVRVRDGGYPPDSIFGRVDGKLSRLAEQVRQYGAADFSGAG